MAKSRPFSIYLLKSGFSGGNSLRQGHDLQAAGAENLPDGCSLYILDAAPRPPWWKGYFGVEQSLLQEHKGALIFMPVGERCFALSFGQVFHHLDDCAYEYDFGLRVSLNCLNPRLLKSADMVSPGDARRKRTQVPISTELTYLDFDSNSEIIKSLTGAVKPEYAEFFKNATGGAAFKVSLKLQAGQLPRICETLLELYKSDAFTHAFPNIQNIAPVNDPSESAPLDAALLQAFKLKEASVKLGIPDIIDYRDNTCCVFQTASGTSEVEPDVSLDALYDFVDENLELNAVSLEDLRAWRMLLTDSEGKPAMSYQLFRALIFDYEPDGQGVIYHLCEGKWYKAQKAYVDRLHAYLDTKCEDADLCPYNHDEVNKGHLVYSEGKYNEAVPEWDKTIICLDKTDISPAGNTAVEPCDLYKVIDDPNANGGLRAVLYGVKISTRSSQLSHLFNQGLNAVELLRLEEAALVKLKVLVSERLGANDQARYHGPIDASEFKVTFGVITRRDKAKMSRNLPLFSKISLMRNMQKLDLYRIPAALIFIKDDSAAKDGFAKYPTFDVEVFDSGNGVLEIRALPGQDVDSTRAISRCPKVVRESAVGSRFKLMVKVSTDGALSSYHGWPYEAVV